MKYGEEQRMKQGWYRRSGERRIRSWRREGRGGREEEVELARAQQSKKRTNLGEHLRILEHLSNTLTSNSSTSLCRKQMSKRNKVSDEEISR